MAHRHRETAVLEPVEAVDANQPVKTPFHVIGQAVIGLDHAGPFGVAPVPGHLDGVQHGVAGRLIHIGMIRMPFAAAVGQPDEVAVLHFVGQDHDLRLILHQIFRRNVVLDFTEAARKGVLVGG